MRTRKRTLANFSLSWGCWIARPLHARRNFKSATRARFCLRPDGRARLRRGDARSHSLGAGILTGQPSVCYRAHDGEPVRATTMTRRSILAALLATCFCLFAVGPATAQHYPNRVIKMIVPFPPGGPIDTMARLVAHGLSTRLAQEVVVENRPGAGSTLGSKAAASAEADGYTLLFGSSGSLAVAPALYAKLNIDPLKLFAPVASVSLLPHVFVVAPSVPAKSVQEFVAYAKANPGKLNYGAGLGTPPHLPIDVLLGLYPLVKEGKVRALGIARAERWPALPAVSTLVESGFPDFTHDAWTGVVAPAGTPRDVIDILNRAINDGLQSAEMKANLIRFSAIAKPGTPQDFAAFMQSELPKWADLVKLAGATAQ